MFSLDSLTHFSFVTVIGVFGLPAFLIFAS